MVAESCGGRFPALCATSLPKVSNYDFETNIFTRGKENRSFRWEDVHVDATWLFREATSQGDLEYLNWVPSTRKSLIDLDFTDGGELSSLLTFSRSSTATYIGSDGLIQSAASGAARVGAYAPGGTMPGILMEGARTQVLTNAVWAGGTTPTSWTLIGSTPTVTSSTYGSSDGGIALRMTSSSSQTYLSQSVSLTSNTTYALSVYVEAVDGSATLNNILYAVGLPSGCTISSYLQNGSTSSGGTVAQVGRVTMILSGTYTGASATIRVGCSANSSVTRACTISRPQFEAATFPSSFIPSGTRNGETCYLTLTSAQAAILSVGGTMVVEYTLVGGDSTNSSGSRIYASIDSGYSSNRVTAYNASGAVGSLVITETAAQANTVKAGTIAANSKSKIACSWAANSFNVAAGGGSGTRDPSGSVPSVARLGIGGASYGSGQAYAIIHRITVYENSTESDTTLAYYSESNTQHPIYVAAPELLSSTGESTITYPNTTGYMITTGWMLTGGYTQYIGVSGTQLSTGNLSGYLGDPFWSNPITNSKSIGLWCNSDDIPKLLATGITTGNGGILLDNNHQAYLVATCNNYTGELPRLKAYIKANDSTSGLGYYDPINKEWTTSLPTGSFSITSTGYTEIKYNFNPSSLPFSNPVYYDFIIENPTTGAFITVDDIHIDQYMKKNPYTDYILPTGYMFQITPDLGWHNPISQFDGDGANLNPFLKTIGPFMIENGNLIDNLDNSVTAILDESDFTSSIQTRYKKYLWRVIGILPNGDLGEAGLPEKFEYVGNDIENNFDILSIDDSHTSTIKTIVGKRNGRINVIVDDIENHPGVTYTSETSWTLNINVDGIHRTVKIYGKDIGGATTSVRYIELSNIAEEMKQRALWNVFDDHGLVLDTKRLPKESNSEYLERLKDVNINRAGTTFVGLLNGTSRELGLKKIPTAFQLSIPKDSFSNNIHQSLSIINSSASLSIRSTGMIITERLPIDRIYGTIDLSKAILDLPIHAESDEGVTINLKDIEIAIDEDRPSIQRLKITREDMLGKFITITYQYYECLRYKDYPTLGSLYTALKNLTDHSGLRLVSVTLDNTLSGGENSLGLYIGSSAIIGDQVTNIAWSPVILRKVSDKEFREFFISKDGTYHRTKFQGYVDSLRKNSKTFWVNIVSDIDYWADDNLTASFDSIPTVFDPEITKFISRDHTGSMEVIDSSEAWGNNYIGNSGEYIQNIGTDYTYLQPGVAYKSDLQPDIEAYQIIYNRTVSNVSYLVESINSNNKVVIFSGQR